MVGYGVAAYFRDKLNWIDAFVVFVSIFEILFLGDDTDTADIRIVLDENMKYLTKDTVCREFTGPIVSFKLFFYHSFLIIK